VKTNSDFPNMVFMLLFQRNIAEKAVEGSVKDSGRGYLEKIVNVSFTVPTISSITLGKYFTMEMDRIFKGSNFSESELDRFKSLYWNGVSKYAQNIRAVKRLVSSLTFSISLLRNGDSLEVNPTDIVAIETLRLFEGDIYEMLPRLKELLRKACIYNNERKQVQAEIERAVAIVADEERRSAALNIIHLIFPFGSNTDGWYRDKRICHDCLFDRYFLLRLCDDDISHAEIERLVKISGNYDIFITALRNYIRQGRIDNLLSRMEYYKVIIPPQNLNAFISAIFDIGDELIDDKDASFFLTASDYASRIARRALMEEKDIDKRGIILADTISKTSGLLLPVGVISLINNDYLEKEVDDNTLMELKKICVNKIRNSPDKILSNSHPRRIIYIWTEWASQREVSDWFAAQITNHDALRKIIVAYTSCVNSSAVPHQRWYSALEEIEKYVNIDDLEREVKNLDKSKLNSEELRALNAFDKALSRKKAGKPYDNKSLTKDDT
jgi:predicted KAP-like P-loop ATPase